MKQSGNFEKKLTRLEEIVEQLESGELDIEATLELFQEGMKLGKDCRTLLDEIELKVNKIMKDTTGGEPETEEYDG